MIRWVRNLKIGVRIIIGFLLVAFIACAIGGIGIFSLRQINGTYKIAYTDSVDAMEHTESISSSFQRIRANLNGLILAEEQVDKEYYIERMAYFKSIIDENIAGYNEMLSQNNSEEAKTELQLLGTVQTSLTSFGEKRKQLIDASAMDSSQRSDSFNLIKKGGELHTLATAVDDAINELINFNKDNAANQINANVSQAASSTVVMVIGAALGVLLAILVGVFISRGISKPIGKIVEAADKLAVGDMNITASIDTKDEIGMLAKSFSKLIASTREQALAAERIANADLTVDVDVRSENDLLGKKLSELVNDLNEIMNSIASASEQVASGSKQISDSSMALSQGATEQASSIEELTASIEEISSQTRLNTQNANEANALAENAKIDAMNGNTQMQEMLKAMEEINESSTNISKIIKVIDDIAFQTNMLALNAAVEAARAGQHGKGFAVVAEEVKNLAARSANAAKETTEMIEGSIKKTEGGTRVAKATAEALNKIVNEIDKVASLVSDISVASNEQDAGISQINQGIMQVSQVVQTNSATSEESAAASEELSSQAELLQDMVGKFKLKKINQPYSKLSELSPEVLKMLESM